ncbi:MAG: hypothetical protein ONA69_06320 [candidate division KSB1 bacterium]|nr:hypothetical protein [candidate division KSB1 bacterium]MDZ7346397.1 hypothetical protein [candidate division KSB1 bacterium]
MRTKALPLIAALCLFFSFSCTENKGDKPSFGRPKNAFDRSRLITQEEIERRALELQALQAETEALYRSLKEKELMLLRKQATLDSLQLALEKKEAEIRQREKAAKKLRNSGTLLFLVGIALIFFGLRKNLAPKPKSAVPAQPPQK